MGSGPAQSCGGGHSRYLPGADLRHHEPIFARYGGQEQPTRTGASPGSPLVGAFVCRINAETPQLTRKSGGEDSTRASLLI